MRICGRVLQDREAQRLTLARLERQTVPIMLLDTDGSLENFRKSFPIVIEHIDREYIAVSARTSSTAASASACSCAT